jgi:tRNA G18 (ribose-2'-O)-methylase SpoU
MGTVFQVPWTMALPEESGETKLIEILHSYGYSTAAMALSDDSLSVSDDKLKAEGKMAIVLGTEGDGLPQQVIRDADYTVRIPMSHQVDSLNVAAASAVAFWELRQVAENHKKV